MRLVYAAFGVLGAGWAPLVVVGLLDPTANPIGLGLLGMAGTLLAALLLVVAAARAKRRGLR